MSPTEKSARRFEQVPVPAPERSAALLPLAVTDILEHGGVPRESHIRSGVRLLKG